jgi:hypothetical protein
MAPTETNTATAVNPFEPFDQTRHASGAAASGLCSQCKTRPAEWSRRHGQSLRAYCGVCKARAEGQLAAAPVETGEAPMCGANFDATVADKELRELNRGCGMFEAHYLFTDAKGRTARVCFVCGTQKMNASRPWSKDGGGNVTMGEAKGKLVRVVRDGGMDAAVKAEGTRAVKAAGESPFKGLPELLGFEKNAKLGVYEKRKGA